MLRKLVVTLSALFVVLLVLTSVPIANHAQAATAAVGASTPTRTATRTPTVTSTPTTPPKPSSTPTAPTTSTQVPVPVPTDNLPGVATVEVTAEPTAVPATVPDRNFPETGFTVPGVFVKFWDANGGLPIFGYPISDAHNEAGSDGKTYQVQYFERNRFEYHPEFAGTNNEVLLGLLGADLNQWRTFPTVDAFTDTAGRVYFDPTKHSLADPFLTYWNNHGGLAVFGYPISEPFNEQNNADGKTYLVQYFQRNRFEFHPENQPPYDVLLGLLGRDYMQIEALQTVWGTPIPGGQPIVQAIMPPATPAAGGSRFLKGDTLGTGLNVQLFYQNRDTLLRMANDLDFGWVTQQVEWKTTENPKGSYDWSELDRVVNDTLQHKVKILISVVKAPTWATGNSGNGYPKDPKDLQDFMQVMAAHFKGRVAAYMIWNEQNLTGESGVIDPGRYVELLKAGYLGVKAVDPDAVVVSGALAPTDTNDPEGKTTGGLGVMKDTDFLEAMYQYNNGEMKAYADVIGTHPYGFNNPPETKWPDNPNLNPAFPKDSQGRINFYNLHNSFYFRRIEDQRAIMEKYGDGEKQMWVTEYGWCSDEREGGYQECLYNSPEQQGEYIVRAMQFAKQYYPWMGPMFIWNLNFSTFQAWFTGPSHYSILNGDFTPRPAYNIIKNRP